jgi:polycomb protein EED
LKAPTNLNSICWTKDSAGRPLLCAAGSHPRAILIFDLEHDDPIRVLPGHGKAINDLQISPISPDILVSASEDYSIRIWNLNPKHEKQPCRAIFGGQGHKQPLLTIEFHPNGRWLLSGAMDTAIALWAVPSLDELDSKADDNLEPRVIAYPCFISQEVHSNFVDCVKWYGDSILSRAARAPSDGIDKKMEQNEILLWRIDGFDSSMPHPAQPPIPYPGVFTRTAFPHSDRSRGFERLLTFETKFTARFYLRFGLFHEPGKRPILAMGNERSKVYFWDLQKCEEGEDVVKKGKGGKKKTVKNGLSMESLSRISGNKRDDSVASDGASGMSCISTPKSDV